ncbi:MAG TPA: carbonic anhydrase [Vulgatibacter sp.]|nr:carbonic anhydrase [Vulgatibacter sp.]
MSTLTEYLAANREWAARMRERDPSFFDRLREQQKPRLLWIGCSDSRIPPDQLLGKLPGSIFVHRNVGNVVVHTDVNCLSVLQYGIEVLGIQDVIVCGHYGCGGVQAALGSGTAGVSDMWLGHIRDVYMWNREELDAIASPEERAARLCELNVAAQVANVCRTTIVRDAWKAGRPLAVHGWVYSIADGLLKDVGLCVEAPGQIPHLPAGHGATGA